MSPQRVIDLLPAKAPVILIIDDNPLNLEVLESFLLSHHFEVLVARDSESGLEYAQNAQPDLILLDVFLPDRDGFETCRLLREGPRTHQIPVIFVTALADDIDSKLRGFSLGAVDYIAKPFQEIEVLARIATHLRLQELTRQLQQRTDALQLEVYERQRAEAELRSYQGRLEQLVQDRTTELIGANAQLRQEVAERQHAEARIRASLHEKEILLKEIHHRVKNNLQIIASLLYLQTQKINAPQFAELLHESQNRINSMAFVHEMLYQSDDYTRVDFGLYLRSLSTSLMASYGIDQHQIALGISAPDVTMSVNLAIPCGLIVNEVVSNALKHAFPGGRCGNIRIVIAQLPDKRYQLELSDDGVGMAAPTGGPTTTLGLRLIDRLVKQLGGTLEIQGGAGTSYRIIFPSDS